jgi:hypothetical protein
MWHILSNFEIGAKQNLKWTPAANFLRGRTISSRTRHHVLAMAALDKSLSIVS